MIDRLKSLVADVDAWTMRHRTSRVSRRAITGFMEHEALQYGGSMAYFAVLSVFQLLVLGVVIGSFVLGEGAARDFVVEQVEAGSPLDADTVGAIIDGVIESRGGMTIVSVAFLAWSASGVFSALSNGINRVFADAPKRPFVKDKLIGLVLMALTGVLALASLVIGIVTGILQRTASDLIGAFPGGETAVWLIGLVVPVLLIFLAFLVIYKVVPNRPVSWGEVLPGALVASLLWTLLRFGFTWYATNLANYESAFGPLSTGITLLVFLYFASVIILLGAEFARANALDDELGAIEAADPRFLPVVTDPAPAAAAAPSRRLPAWLLVGGGAVAGLLAGRLTGRKDDRDHL